MGDLMRTRSGPFTLDESVTLDTLKKCAAAGHVHELIYTIEEVLKYKTVHAPVSEEKRILNGGAFRTGDEGVYENGLVFVAVNGVTTGIYMRAGDWYKPRVMFTGG